MKKVLFGVTIPATANAFLRDQLAELSKQGWDVHLATSPGEGFEELHTITGISIHPLPMKRNPSPAADLQSLMEWIKLIKRVDPDILVASTPKAGLIGMLAARIRKTPIRVYHVRGLRAEGLQGLAKRISLFSEKLAASCATEVLCDSPSLLSEMRNLNLFNQDSGLVLGAGSCCGVDIAKFHPPSILERITARKEFGIEEDEIVLGFVGRLTEDKGIGELIQSAKVIRKTSGRVKLLLVGPVEFNPNSSLAATIESVQDLPWVTFTGQLQDTTTAYHAMDIFCSPSYREGFPIAVLEAQASGIPVVTSTATGCIDAIENNVTGLCVEPRNSTALTEALTSLLNNLDTLRNMSSEARERTTRLFNQRLVNTRFVEFIESI